MGCSGKNRDQCRHFEPVRRTATIRTDLYRKFVDAASSVIEAGACGVHIDFSWITDDKGRRLNRDVPPVEAYSAVVAPLRARFGNDFVVNVNVLPRVDVSTWCVSSGARRIVRGGALCARPSRRFHGSGNSDARRYRRQSRNSQFGQANGYLPRGNLIDAGILKKPYNWLLLYGLPYDTGQTLISQHLVAMRKTWRGACFIMRTNSPGRPRFCD